MVIWTFPIEYKYSPFDKSNESIESTKVYGALLQQRYSFPIEYKYSPFDKSNESIKSTKVYGALLQQRYSFPIEYKYSPFDKSNESIESTNILFQSNISILHLTNRTNRSNRQKFMGPYYNSDIFLSLANDMQQSNGKLDFSNRI